MVLRAERLTPCPSPLSTAEIRRASSWRSGFRIESGPHISAPRTKHFGARARPDAPVNA